MYRRHILEMNDGQLNVNKSHIDPLWNKIELEYSKSLASNSIKDKTVDKDLKIIRIFISSTFKDFYSERDVLVKNVFPKLRKWCEEQGLYLVECDLRWGVPSDATNLEAVSYCLDEIEKSREETNNHNFFLCLIGERYGWVPSEEALVKQLKIKYDFIDDSSVTLMEIVHGVLRSGTENSLFMIRQPNILTSIPNNHLQFYEESDTQMRRNVEEQKKFIKKHFLKTGCVKEYKINYQATVIDQISGKERIVFTDFDEFSEIVLEYFKIKISTFKTNFELNSSIEDQNEDLIHKTFLRSIIKDSIKREDYIKNLSQRIYEIEMSSEENNPIILFTGEAGSGKSTIMGNLIEYFMKQSDKNVFYHYCGASNMSHSHSNIVKRYMNHIGFVSVDNESSEEKEPNLTHLLEKQDILKPIIIFIDAVDELWDLNRTKTFPKSTRKNILLCISCLFNANPESIYSSLTTNDYCSQIIEIERMDKTQLSGIASAYLNNFGKKLDSQQIDVLMSFDSSKNPLWLLSVCEELRIHGDYSSLTKLITALPNTIADLNRMVIKRLTDQDKSNIIRTLLQLLTVSRAGLWESLIKDILAAILNYSEPISHSMWTDVVWQLKGFLQVQSIPLPLIKLRHRVMKESIEAQLEMSEEYLISLHQKLALFLETVMDSASDMFLADYVYHLIKSNARNRLIDFMRNPKSWTILKQSFVRSRILSSMRCINPVSNLPGQKLDPLRMCVFCANKTRDLSIYSVNKYSCTFCGSFVGQNINTNEQMQLYACQFHKSSAMMKCHLCGKINPSGQGESLKICQMCRMQSFAGNCGVVIKENDILYQQQMGFSRAAYRIESLI